jgi:hypothetical protein
LIRVCYAIALNLRIKGWHLQGALSPGIIHTTERSGLHATIAVRVFYIEIVRLLLRPDLRRVYVLGFRDRTLGATARAGNAPDLGQIQQRHRAGADPDRD